MSAAGSGVADPMAAAGGGSAVDRRLPPCYYGGYGSLLAATPVPSLLWTGDRRRGLVSLGHARQTRGSAQR